MGQQLKEKSDGSSDTIAPAIAFLEEHHQILTGAIDHLLYRILFNPDLMRSVRTIVGISVSFPPGTVVW
ncbi:hypothetical protein CRP01_00005 [Flavilitoribacter nigricans DSM 23189 = NBRC 102662]|uniref:Uncharacterized protein n=1 Tax=Flavilitoribacter nigricans (strain ATCC 23147 / DSM 23189 / NBRC 102662 / NCIMB 1420 / SS-2) TaxID=1122177 RepID=A0A2D0NIK4_FLAN2|nr:hypothetical protein CRP01_00005 [Flavilitoribacter nigricans DSM 23189 = NBRC 102662]